jgi:pyruvate formate lyase activating enzyme
VVIRDLPFYKTSGGGMTLSGGEPLYQFEFTHQLLYAAKQHGLHTAVETSGCVAWERLAAIQPITDLFLYDLKVIDPIKHRKLCGADNALILENARRLSETGVDMVFRTPIIPGCNDSVEDLRRLGAFVLSMSHPHPVELMPYHSIGCSKYKALGLRYALPDVAAPANMDGYKAVLAKMGLACR